MAAKASSKAASKPAKDYYNVSGGSVERTNQFCPRCGEGVFLAEHKDRRSCGKCGYTEFKK